MNKYAQGGDLTQFNEGGLHSQNPLGGIPIGGNNSVEQGETKQDNFVYSNRIFLDSNIVSQYNLPKSLVGKSVADATKMIDNKFKGRNDKISQSTKNGMLSKIAEAQEAMKPQEPEMEQPQEGIEQGYPQEIAENNQMWDGGFKQSTIGQGFGADATGAQQSAAIGAGLGVGMAAFDLGKTAFGKPNIDTSGQFASEQVNSGAMIGGSALKGAQAGMAFGPWGAGIGAVVGAGAGLLGANKAKKAAAENTNNYAINTNKKFSDNYFAYGGKINQMALGGPGEGTLNNDDLTQQLSMAYKTGNPVNAQYGNNVNPIANVQTTLGLNPGKWGPKSKATLSKYQSDNGLTSDGKYGPNTFKSMGLTPGGRQYVAPVSQLTAKEGFKQQLPTSNAKVSVQQFVNTDIPEPSFGQKVWNGAKAAGKYSYENAGNLARYAPIAANALQLAQLQKPQGESLDRLGNRYKSEYVDEANLQNIANQTMNNSVNAIGQSGASQGQLRSSIIGSQLQRTKAISDAYSQAAAQNRATNDRAQTFNLGVDQVNLQQSNSEKDINARDQAAYRNAKREYITGIGEGIGGIGNEQAYKKIAKNTTGYTWDGTYVKTPDGNIVTNPTTGKPMTQEELKQSQASKDKKALGGYLIKNKRQ